MNKLPKKLHYRLAYLVLGEALRHMENVNVKPGIELRLDGDQWYASFAPSETGDRLDSTIILVCEKGYYVDRNLVETIEYRGRVGDIFQDWSIPVIKKAVKDEEKVEA